MGNKLPRYVYKRRRKKRAITKPIRQLIKRKLKEAINELRATH